MIVPVTAFIGSPVGNPAVMNPAPYFGVNILGSLVPGGGKNLSAGKSGGRGLSVLKKL
jgi:hypothetical protein